MQVLALPHPHGTALLAEITPFDPEEDELDGCEATAGSDTGGEQWWVPGEAGRGVREGMWSAGQAPSCGMLSLQGRDAGAQLAGAGLREGGAAAGDAEKAGGECCPAGGDRGLPARGDSGAGSPSSSSHTLRLGPWRGKPQGSSAEQKKGRRVLSPCSLTWPHAGGGPSIWDPLVPAMPGSGLMVLVNEVGPKREGGVWGWACGSP